MSHVRVIICRVEEDEAAGMTELASFDLPGAEVARLEAERALDEIEATTVQVGQRILQQLIRVQWEEIDRQVGEAQRAAFSP